MLVGLQPGAATESLRATLKRSPGIAIRDVRPDEERRALREGIVNVVVVPTTPPTYRFDPAREESRLARVVVDDALKRAAGRTDPGRRVKSHRRWPARATSTGSSPG